MESVRDTPSFWRSVTHLTGKEQVEGRGPPWARPGLERGVRTSGSRRFPGPSRGGALLEGQRARGGVSQPGRRGRATGRAETVVTVTGDQ